MRPFLVSGPLVPEKLFIRENTGTFHCSPFGVSIPLVPAFDTNMEFSRLRDKLADNPLRLPGRSISLLGLGYVTQTTSDLLHLRWRKVFSPSAESELREKH